MPYCGQTTLVNDLRTETVAQALTCRSWGCPDCYPDRRRKLIRNAHRGSPTTFLTLTVSATKHPQPNDAAAKLAHAWRLLRLRIMRRWKLKRLPFLAVVEATKLGRPHLHVLLRVKFIPQDWLSRQMDELMGSPIVHIRRITKREQIGAYIAKYCGKCSHKFGNTKRYWQSRDYAPDSKDETRAPTPASGGWVIEETTIQRLFSELQRAGWSVAWTATRRFVGRAPGIRAPPPAGAAP